MVLSPTFDYELRDAISSALAKGFKGDERLDAVLAAIESLVVPRPKYVNDELRERITEALLTPGLSIDRVTDLVDEIAESIIDVHLTTLEGIAERLCDGWEQSEVRPKWWVRRNDWHRSEPMLADEVRWFTERGEAGR